MPDSNRPRDLSSTTPSAAAAEEEEEEEEETTGLPGLRSWRGVYWVVFGCFLLWVFLLALLAKAFA